MFERINQENQFVLNEIQEVLEDMRNIAGSSLPEEGRSDARRQRLREAAASGNALRLRLLLEGFVWSDEEVALALFAVTSRRAAIVIARARPQLFQAAAPWAVRGALLAEDLAALRGLLDAGAPHDAPCGYLRETPLHLAAACRNFNCALELLLRGARPDARDANGETPLHRAASQGRVAAVWLLLRHAPAPSVHARDRQGRTPLHRALRHGHARCAEMLLRPHHHAHQQPTALSYSPVPSTTVLANVTSE